MLSKGYFFLFSLTLPWLQIQLFVKKLKYPPSSISLARIRAEKWFWCNFSVDQVTGKIWWYDFVPWLMIEVVKWKKLYRMKLVIPVKLLTCMIFINVYLCPSYLSLSNKIFVRIHIFNLVLFGEIIFWLLFTIVTYKVIFNCLKNPFLY